MRKAEDGQHVGGSQTSGAGKNIQESRETEQRRREKGGTRRKREGTVEISGI